MGPAVYAQIQTQADGEEGLTVKGMCQLAGISRAGLYRFRPASLASKPDMALRDAIQHVALEFPSYGWRRITAELRRQKWAVNHKRVYRWMHADNLLCLRKRKFVVTTDSDHGLRVYPNLARALTLTGLDQLWVADLTYIRLELEFVYLAVMLDAFSRPVIGWALKPTLEAALTLQALRMAWRDDGRSPNWCITPIVGCSTPAAITPDCFRSTASGSACRARRTPGTMRLANRSSRL
jgi:transposase InsO family protein